MMWLGRSENGSKSVYKSRFSFFRASGGLRFHYSDLLRCSEPAKYVSSKASLHVESGNSMIGPDDDENGLENIEKADVHVFK